MTHANASFHETQNKYIRLMAKKLSSFLTQHDLIPTSPDKGKGWVISQSSNIEAKLQESIVSNFHEFTQNRPAREGTDTQPGREAAPYTHEQYLTYRENKVRKHVTDLKQKPGSLDYENNYTITAQEVTKACTQASSLSQHVPLGKIHKFLWLDEQTHGDGKPINMHILQNHPQEHANLPLQNKLKFRFVLPLKNSPSAPLGKLINSLLLPIQNSGLRNDSMWQIAKNVQENIRIHPLSEDEEFVSFDVVSFYDRLDTSLFKHCISKMWTKFLAESGRNIDLNNLFRAVDVCYDDGILFKNKIYRQKHGAPTGHPISSCAQNVVMSCFELEIIKPLIEQNIILFYERWVDDTLIRIKSKDLNFIKQKFETFHEKLEFTVEHPEKILYKSKIYNFIPFLDFSINWSQNDSFTRVYRKPTSSRVVMPWNEFGPMDWKTGTLIGAIRRELTHTSLTHMHLVHEGLEFVRKQFSDVGYPKWLIGQKINHTVTKILYPHTLPKQTVDTNENNQKQRWLPLFLPWAGDKAHESIRLLRRSIPNDFAKVSIAYTTSKIRSLLPSFSTNNQTPENKILLANNLVYKYTCSCGQVYIGETQRRLSIRISEHQTRKDSAIKDHILVCTSSDTVERDKFSVVAKRLRHRDARKRFESIYIRYYDKRAHSTMNGNKSSRELACF